MRPTPIPMLPVLACIAGASTIGLGLWLQFNAPDTVIEMPAMQYADQRGAEDIENLKYHDAPITIETAELIVNSSGFSPDRSEYSRTAQRAAPERREPEYNPKYVGSLGRGDQMRVMIVWRPGEEARSHRIGDETPWGKITEISSTEIAFKAVDRLRTLSLF